jgi:hypothetical protein
VPVDERPGAPDRVAGSGLLDLEDGRAQVGELHGRERRRHERADLQHGDAVKRGSGLHARLRVLAAVTS